MRCQFAITDNLATCTLCGRTVRVRPQADPRKIHATCRGLGPHCWQFTDWTGLAARIETRYNPEAHGTAAEILARKRVCQACDRWRAGGCRECEACSRLDQWASRILWGTCSRFKER